MPIDDADIQWLLALVEAEDLAEIEIHIGDSQVLVRRQLTAVSELAGQAAVGAQVSAPEPALPDTVVPIVAPMAGVFYRAASPESPPFVEVGQEIEVGDIVGLIEAMKLFNDVTATVAGTVYKIVVRNEEQVEAGRPLMYVEPAA